jgi:hypothetical protein
MDEFNQNFNQFQILQPPSGLKISNPKIMNKLIVTWNEIPNMQYNLYRGLSQQGIFYKINNTPIIDNRFEDIIDPNPNATYWYKISSIYNNIESKLSLPIMFQNENTNKWLNKMNQRSMWVLKNTGVLMDLYTRKVTGERCDCYNETYAQSDNPTCPKCFGTTYIDGYEPRCQIYVREKPIQQDLQLLDRGLVINSKPGAWTLCDINIKNRDLLINPQGIIYSVTNSMMSHVAGFLLHQELQLVEIDPLDIRYKIPRKTIYPLY